MVKCSKITAGLITTFSLASAVQSFENAQLDSIDFDFDQYENFNFESLSRNPTKNSKSQESHNKQKWLGQFVGDWDNWSEYGDCNGGVMYRTRICRLPFQGDKPTDPERCAHHPDGEHYLEPATCDVVASEVILEELEAQQMEQVMGARSSFGGSSQSSLQDLPPPVTAMKNGKMRVMKHQAVIEEQINEFTFGSDSSNISNNDMDNSGLSFGEDSESTNPNPFMSSSSDSSHATGIEGFKSRSARNLPKLPNECQSQLFTCGPSLLYTITGTYNYTGSWTNFEEQKGHKRPAYQLYDRMNGRHRNLWIADWYGNKARKASWLLSVNGLPQADGKFQFYAYADKNEIMMDEMCPTSRQDDYNQRPQWKLGWNHNPVRFSMGFRQNIQGPVETLQCGKPINGYNPYVQGISRKKRAIVEHTETTEEKKARLERERLENMFRIVGGTEARAHTYPWQVALFHRKQFCGGVLVHPYFVLTAAHCVHNMKSEMSVILGAHDLEKQSTQEQTICVAGSEIVHHGWNPERPDHGNDIALLRLAWPAVISETVRPLCLNPSRPKLGATCVATGWGYTDTRVTGRQEPTKLHQIPMVVESCHWSEQTPSLLCAKGSHNGTKEGEYGTTCVGDSGGPLACLDGDTWSLSGLVSFGMGNAATKQVCGYKNTPSVFTGIDSHFDWITSTIQKQLDADAHWSHWSEWSNCKDNVSKRTRHCKGTKGLCLGDDSEDMFCQPEVSEFGQAVCKDPVTGDSPCHERATCTALPSGGVKCNCIGKWEGDGLNTETGCTLEEKTDLKGNKLAAKFCPPIDYNQKYTAKARLFDITWDDLVLDKNCTSGEVGALCNLSCGNPIHTSGINQVQCRCGKKSSLNDCAWVPTDKIAYKTKQREIQCRDRRPFCESDLAKEATKAVGKTLKTVKTTVESLMGRNGVQVSKRSSPVNFNWHLTNTSSITTQDGKTINRNLVNPSDWANHFGMNHRNGTRFIIAIGLEGEETFDGKYMDFIHSYCECSSDSKRAKCDYKFNLVGQQKRSKKFPKMSHILKSDLISWSFDLVMKHLGHDN